MSSEALQAAHMVVQARDDARTANGSERVSDALPGSFEARMQTRRRERELRTTELFEPPGFEDMFRVEMQVLGYKRLASIVLAHQRMRDETLQALYANADIVLAATVGFQLVGDDGELHEPEQPLTWVDLARAYDPTLDAATRPRVALIRLLEGQGIAQLWNLWNDWNTHGNAQVDRDLSADFQVTG